MFRPLFTPVLFAGFAMRFIPMTIIENIISKITAVLNQPPNTLVERLRDLDDATWLIDPLDLPFKFYLFIEHDQLQIKTVDKNEDLLKSSAIIHASLFNLLKMVDGQSDGDALFFNRELVIEGSMDSVVALRNGLDATGINLEKIVASFGLLGSVALKTKKTIAPIYAQMQTDMTLLAQAITGDFNSQIDQQSQKIKQLQQEISELNRMRSQLGTRQVRAKIIS